MVSLRGLSCLFSRRRSVALRVAWVAEPAWNLLTTPSQGAPGALQQFILSKVISDFNANAPRVKLEPPSCETATSRCGTSPSSPTTGRASKVAKLDLEKSRDEDQDWKVGSTWASSLQEIDQHVSFVPVEGSTDPEPESPRHLIPNRRIAVADILPLSLSSGQVGRTVFWQTVSTWCRSRWPSTPPPPLSQSRRSSSRLVEEGEESKALTKEGRRATWSPTASSITSKSFPTSPLSCSALVITSSLVTIS